MLLHCTVFGFWDGNKIWLIDMVVWEILRHRAVYLVMRVWFTFLTLSQFFHSRNDVTSAWRVWSDFEPVLSQQKWCHICVTCVVWLEPVLSQQKWCHICVTCVVCCFPYDEPNQFLTTFSTNLLSLFVSSSYYQVRESVAEHRNLLIPISF